MRTERKYPIDEGFGASNNKTKEEAARRLAAVSLKNGSALEHELEAALEAAQRAGSSNLQYLHERLLLEAGIHAEDWRDDGAGDEQC